MYIEPVRALFSRWRIGFYVIILFFLAHQTTLAQTFPANFTQVAVATGLTKPAFVKEAPDGRLFVSRQTGDVNVIKNGALLPTPFIKLTVDSNGEHGVLGIAFDPDFATNQYVYLYYTVPTSGTITVHNRVSRFTATGDVVLAGSEAILLDLDSLNGLYHNSGALAFGPDNKLYVSVGENQISSNSQNLDTYLGKVLRINPDGTVPSGNPFTSGSEVKKRIWAYGLRNPYTMSFQPGTGRLFVNDVGENSWEEINDATTGGLNFGWPATEGVNTNPDFTNPVFAYTHTGAGECAITGGAFYNPVTNAYPSSYVGKYIYLDYCAKWIKTLDLSGATPVSTLFASNIAGQHVDLITSKDGYLYYLNTTDSSLYKIIYTDPNCQRSCIPIQIQILK